MTLKIDQALKLASQAKGMNAKECASVLSLLMGGTLAEEEGARILKTWAKRGETGVELAAAVNLLKENAVKVPVVTPCFDLCGTGGSGLSRYNISTTVAFIVAAAGIPVAKHGNRGSRRPNGSFDLLEALGVPFEFTPAQEAEIQEQTGLCFLFARTHHPAVGKVVPYRKAAGCRSIFNLAGPLANPAEIKHQVIGTNDEKTARVVAEALQILKTQGALVVWGEPGIDEISVTGKTGTLLVTPTGVRTGEFNKPSFPNLDYDSLPSGDAEENKITFLRLLSGEETGPLLSMLCENAGACIDLWRGRDPKYGGDGAQEAFELITSGKAMSTFEMHKKEAHHFLDSES